MKSKDAVKMEKPSNSKIIRSAITVILALSFLALALIINLRGRADKVLDVKAKHLLKVVRILDLRYPKFSEQDFMLFLRGLEKEIKNKLGYSVEFQFVKTVLADNWLSADLDIFSTQAAKDWFKGQYALKDNFNWLKALLKAPQKRKLLSSYYPGSENLLVSIKKDFISKKKFFRNIKSHHEGDKIKNSGAYWDYFLENFVSADFVVSNSPIFYPYKDIPVDAVTRGGGIVNLLTKAKNKAGRSYLLSLYSIFEKLGNHKNGLKLATKLGLQGFASYLTGMSLSADSRSSMYPLRGYDFNKWLVREQRSYNVDLANFKKLMLKRK